MRQRGQAVPVIAIMATLLVGVTALMVDLSLQTHNRRTLQNVTDAAALAGARELGAKPAQADRIAAAKQALQIIHTQLWPGQWSSTWVANTVDNAADCPAGGVTCDVTVVPPAPYANFSVALHVPPVASAGSAYNGKWGYVQVDMSEQVSNNLGGMIGFGTSTEGAHSIAYHFAGNQTFGFALYASAIVGTGNDGEMIQGNVYANRYVQPQSGGQAGFCASGGGYIIFGSPQWPDSNYDATNNPGQHDTPNGQNKTYPVNSVGSCSNTQSGTVNQTGAPLANGQDCSGAVNSTTFQGKWYGGGGDALHACVANPAIYPPTLEAPTNDGTAQWCGHSGLLPNGSAYQPGVYQCANGTSLQVDAPLQSGLYVINHAAGNNCGAPSCYDLDFKQNISLTGVTFYLQNGATMGVEQGTTLTLTPYNRTNTDNPNDRGVYPVYADSGSKSVLQVTNGSVFATEGTLYMPSGEIDATQNSIISINPGQAIVGTWNVQSGYHPSPDIAWSGQNVAPLREILKLVE